jgi:transcriptional regulator with XRE-family HTH domain
MEFSEKLKFILENFFGGNKSSLADAMGVSRQNINNYFQPEKPVRPSYEALRNLYKIGFSSSWLLGDGESEIYADNEAGRALREKYTGRQSQVNEKQSFKSNISGFTELDQETIELIADKVFEKMKIAATGPLKKRGKNE